MSTSLAVPQFDKQITIEAAWIEQRAALLANANALPTVNTAGQFEEASSLLRDITKCSNVLEVQRKALAKPFREMDEQIKKMADDARAPLETVKAKLQAAIGAYSLAERRKAEAEAAAREKAERERIEKEAAEHAQAVAAGLEEPDAEFQPSEPVAVAAPIAAPPKSSSVAITETLEWEVEDPDKVDPSLMVVDSVKVNAWKKLNADRLWAALRDNPPRQLCAGIKFRIETKVKSR